MSRRMSKLLLAAALTLIATCLVGCGDDDDAPKVTKCSEYSRGTCGPVTDKATCTAACTCEAEFLKKGGGLREEDDLVFKEFEKEEDYVGCMCTIPDPGKRRLNTVRHSDDAGGDRAPCQG
eukprot:gnl/TRDRNA2_/TRDRNA2_144390_c0_seq2.p2 gnl/TRDRNA2_/TRDRNA2_144390_c0~~gnl/TRDRNA2_/TRDRNA2_144390_c0_seq2.p2  ORF type:complete len:121 (+),score=13.77 gnl/TRDRNA2_/TRDRNA2_144390_c0_seq2:47-409(+)